MATYPLATLAPTIDLTGISTPSYNDIYQSLIASFQQVYGSGIYISVDSQDGQWLAILARAIYDTNQAAVAVFQAFSPTYAQGAGLASLVKINGLTIAVPTNSTAVGTAVGTAGTIISNGVVQDASNNLWNLPPSVTIPIGGSVAVTVTAQNKGSVMALAGTINKIYNPQYGWQTFVSTTDATIGNPSESDTTLRLRQSVSTALPSLGIRDSIYAAIGNVIGVTRWTVYENDTGSTDANGVPSHSISCIIAGGSTTDIANAIGGRKLPGGQTYGTTVTTYFDIYGLPTYINYFVLANIQVYFAVTIKALIGYVSTTGTSLIQALVNFVNGLSIGEDVYLSQSQAIASFIASPLGQTFYISDFRLGFAAAPVGTANLVINFNQAAVCAVANVTLTVT